jgi:hypothetical protein
VNDDENNAENYSDRGSFDANQMQSRLRNLARSLKVPLGKVSTTEQYQMNAASNTTHGEILGSEGSFIDENYMNRNHDGRA